MPKYRVNLRYNNDKFASYSLDVRACSEDGAEWIAKATIADCGWWPGNPPIENIMKRLTLHSIEVINDD